MSLFYNGIMKDFWNCNTMKQSKYYLINQTQLSKIY